MKQTAIVDFEDGPQNPESQQKSCFEHKGQGILALQTASASPVDEDGGTGCPEQKRQQGAKAGKNQLDFTDG